MVRGWNKLKKWERRPTTIGKIETFHKAYVNEARFFNRHCAFIHYNNYPRPHKPLNYPTPATVYSGDPKVKGYFGSEQSNLFIPVNLIRRGAIYVYVKNFYSNVL